MLGFAFSEAQRSQEIMRRLHQHKGSSPPNPATVTKTGGHKRTRRRRRSKKLHGGGSVGSNTTSTATHSSTVGPASSHSSAALSSHATLSSPTCTTPKPHDAPMTRRDLYFSLRCGMVNVGPQGTDTAVGRVTLVNWDNEIVVDTFVKVPVQITNYRTEVTGITPGLLEHGACSLDKVRKKVGSLIRGKILIGHGLEVDLAALRLSHPWCDMRDTATYAPYMQQIVDPLTRMLLPRTLDDLMQNELEQTLPPGQVSEAVACLSLYKLVREQWEGEIVKLLQHKERQRELVLNMRSASAQPLSRIAEDAYGDEVGAHAHYTGLYMETEHDQPYWTSEYETSTLASEQATLENYEGYRDDISETSSEVDGVLHRPRNQDSETLNPLFENLHLLPELSSSSPSHSPHGTAGSSTAAGTHSTIKGGSLGTSHHSGIWSPLPSTTAVGSMAKTDWSHEPSSAVMRPPGGNWNKNENATTSLSLTEEELREHLPAHLLDDLEVNNSENEGTLFKQDHQEHKKHEHKKKSWFGSFRRRRSLSVPSAESSFAELKAGSKLSHSDRLPRREKADDLVDSGSNARRFFSSEDSSSVLPPPGF